MTREEAIQILSTRDAHGVLCGYTSGVTEALDMAIEALSAKPQTDYISRADAIEAICNAQCELDVPHYPQCDQVKWCDEVKALLALPSADAVHKPDYSYEADMVKRLKQADAVQGEWKPIKETLPTYDGGEKTWLTGMKCSKCGKLFDLRVGYNYCPSCGTRMKGGAE